MAASSDQPPLAKSNRYSQIVEHVFLQHYQEGARVVEFTRDDLIQASQDLSIQVPKNMETFSTHFAIVALYRWLFKQKPRMARYGVFAQLAVRSINL